MHLLLNLPQKYNNKENGQPSDVSSTLHFNQINTQRNFSYFNLFLPSFSLCNTCQLNQQKITTEDAFFFFFEKSRRQQPLFSFLLNGASQTPSEVITVTASFSIPFCVLLPDQIRDSQEPPEQPSLP
ncbi:unnamed protein product [Lactuca virosa]|uniref:Uncharacterized protein n=1 Tax=Lactuca virosa TaxID=75947 RepID=A0AAU9MMB0_9ASTR|nr:unnamed protein product [Lactuca virosa]